MAQTHKDWIALASEGARLSSTEATQLESLLAAGREDLDTRAKLIGYNLFRSDRHEARLHEHILWLISHHPESELLRVCDISRSKHPDVYDQAHALWQRVLEQRPCDMLVWRQAFEFHFRFDRDFCDLIVDQILAVQPDSVYWHARRGALYAFHQCERPDVAVGIRAYRRACEMARPGEQRFDCLIALARLCLEVDPELAEKSVISAGQEHVRRVDARTYGMHHGNITLGRLCLRRGNVEHAKIYLAWAARLRGRSSVLASFGPDLQLASELLEVGERSAVIEYLKACEQIAPMNLPIYSEWRHKLESGKALELPMTMLPLAAVWEPDPG